MLPNHHQLTQNDEVTSKNRNPPAKIPAVISIRRVDGDGRQLVLGVRGGGPAGLGRPGGGARRRNGKFTFIVGPFRRGGARACSRPTPGARMRSSGGAPGEGRRRTMPEPNRSTDGGAGRPGEANQRMSELWVQSLGRDSSGS